MLESVREQEVVLGRRIEDQRKGSRREIVKKGRA